MKKEVTYSGRKPKNGKPKGKKKAKKGGNIDLDDLADEYDYDGEW